MSARTAGELADPSALRLGDHAAAAFSGQAAFDAFAVPFLAAGLAAGERVVVAVEEPDPDRLAALGDVPRLIEEGALILVDAEQAYLRSGRFDPVEAVEAASAAVSQAQASGYAGLRGIADNSLLVEQPSGLASWTRYELLADELTSAQPVLGMCCFDEQRVAPDALGRVLALHPTSRSSTAPRFRLFREGGDLRLTGELESSDVAILEDVLAELAPGDLVIDLADNGFLDHGALVLLARRAQAGATIVALRHANALVGELVEFLGLDDLLQSANPS